MKFVQIAAVAAAALFSVVANAQDATTPAPAVAPVVGAPVSGFSVGGLNVPTPAMVAAGALTLGIVIASVASASNDDTTTAHHHK